MGESAAISDSEIIEKEWAVCAVVVVGLFEDSSATNGEIDRKSVV